MRHLGDNMTSLRRGNRAAVLLCLQEKGALSRKGLAEALSLTPAAMTKIVGELIGEGLLQESRGDRAGVGRREILLSLDPHARWALGVMLGLGHATLSGVWLDGSVIFSETVALPERAEAEGTVARLSRRLMELAEGCGLDKGLLLGLGIAVRGTLSADGRGVKSTFDALDQENFPLCERFEFYTGLPALLSNNVRALFAAQLFLSRDKAPVSQFFLRCDSGIGGAFALEGRVWAGESRQCAEIGHIPVVRRGGKPCHCGKCGCLETIASPAALVAQARERLDPQGTPLLWQRGKAAGDIGLVDVLECARGGDAGACALVDGAVEALAGALKGAIYLLDPGKIVLYGAVFDHPYYLSRLLGQMDEGVDEGHRVPLEKSRFNGQLEDRAAGLLTVANYLENGGMEA